MNKNARIALAIKLTSVAADMTKKGAPATKTTKKSKPTAPAQSKVPVVTDARVVRTYLLKLLKPQGFDCTTARSANDVLTFRQVKYDDVLEDTIGIEFVDGAFDIAGETKDSEGDDEDYPWERSKPWKMLVKLLRNKKLPRIIPVLPAIIRCLTAINNMKVKQQEAEDD